MRKLLKKSFYKNILIIINKNLKFDNKLYFRNIDDLTLNGKGGDQDAVFLCNPFDIITMINKNGIRVEFFSTFGYRPGFINNIIKTINHFPLLGYIGWGTLIIGRKIG